MSVIIKETRLVFVRGRVPRLKRDIWVSPITWTTFLVDIRLFLNIVTLAKVLIYSKI